MNRDDAPAPAGESRSAGELDDPLGDPAEVARVALREDAVARMLEQEIDSLGRLAPFDLAVAWLLSDGRLAARAARGPLATPGLGVREAALSDFGLARRAIDEGRATVSSAPDGGPGQADPSGIVEAAGDGATWAAAPLLLDDQPIGVITLARAAGQTFDRAALDVVDAYGRLLALAVRAATQRTVIDLVRSEGDERKRATVGIHPTSLLAPGAPFS